MAETTVILGTTFDVGHPDLYHYLCPHPSRGYLRAMQSMSLTFTAGALLTLTGGYIRPWTYRVLGDLFTYEVTLRPQHKLVTCAPYNVVRHPSYSGLFMHFAGVAVLHFAEGGWNRECGIMNTPAAAGVVVWIVLSIYAMSSVWRRGSVEDAMMRDTFGDNWVEYHGRVPYKFIPYVV